MVSVIIFEILFSLLSVSGAQGQAKSSEESGVSSLVVRARLINALNPAWHNQGDDTTHGIARYRVSHANYGCSFQSNDADCLAQSPQKSRTNEGASSAQPFASPADRERRRPKIGLALGGGGTRGTAHIGVLRSLEREGIPIDFVAGTSMGAIVGGLYCAGLTVRHIEEMICNKTLMRAYLTVPIPVRVAVIPVFFLPHVVGYHPYDGLYKGRKFAKFINRAVPPEMRNIENMKIPFCAVSANLLDGKGYGVVSGDLGLAVQASSALPFLRRPVELQDKLLMDGGLVENLPSERVRKMGADIVIAVDVDDDELLVKKDFRKIGSTTVRAINMHLTALDIHQDKSADVVIHPNVKGITLLSTDLRDVRRAIAAGEEETMRIIPILKQMIKEKSIAVDAGSDAS